MTGAAERENRDHETFSLAGSAAWGVKVLVGSTCRGDSKNGWSGHRISSPKLSETPRCSFALCLRFPLARRVRQSFRQGRGSSLPSAELHSPTTRFFHCKRFFPPGTTVSSWRAPTVIRRRFWRFPDPVAASEWDLVVYKMAWVGGKIPVFSTEICTKPRTTFFLASVSY